MSLIFKSHGKLLITGEYFVLKGAQSLCIPTKFFQTLKIKDSKEKNLVTVDLSNDEKIVFSQLGINPLIKLGKEYLTSNNFVRLKENRTGEEKTLDHKKTRGKQGKRISKSKKTDEIETNIEVNANSKGKTIKTNENEKAAFLDNKDEIELTDEINNARKKRRRSSASIE